MRPKKPYIATLDEVTITREGDAAHIEYKQENVSGVCFTIGEKIHQMSDQAILDLYNDGLRASLELAKNYQYIATEIPPGKPQVTYFEKGGYWTPRGDVLRCSISWDSEEDTASVWIDDEEFSMKEFGRILSAYEGWGMRLMMVPDNEDSQGSLALGD